MNLHHSIQKFQRLFMQELFFGVSRETRFIQYTVSSFNQIELMKHISTLWRHVSIDWETGMHRFDAFNISFKL